MQNLKETLVLTERGDDDEHSVECKASMGWDMKENEVRSPSLTLRVSTKTHAELTQLAVDLEFGETDEKAAHVLGQE